MELEFTEGDIQLGDNCEFELPHYVVRLTPNEVDHTGGDVIIAAGADPKDGKITAVTLSGRIVLFDARNFYIPDGPAVPCNGGKEIFLENIEGRWPGESLGFYIDSKWIIEKSTPALKGAKLKISY